MGSLIQASAPLVIYIRSKKGEESGKTEAQQRKKKMEKKRDRMDSPST
jgi:hypothetical protein